MQCLGRPVAESAGRLEAATSRLEDIATSTDLAKDGTSPRQAAQPPPTATSLAPPTPAQALTPKPTPKAAQEEPIPEALDDFDQLISSSVQNYVTLSNGLGGGVVAKQV